MQQVNDSKHTATSRKNFIRLVKLEGFGLPGQSPDLNPVECALHILKEETAENRQQIIYAVEKSGKA